MRAPRSARVGVFALVLLLASSAPGVRADDAAPRALVSQEIKVRRGDTLGAIAQRNGVKVTDLRRWNRGRIGKGDVIRAGDTLIVKVPADQANPDKVPARERAAADKVVADKPPAGTWEDHVRVRRGETLSKIAAKNEVALDELMRWNGLSPRSKIKAGQTLKVLRPGPRPPARSPGRPTAGTLEHGVHLGHGPGYRLRFPKNAYGVESVNKTLRACARRVKDAFPGTHDILIGDLSRPGGGRFPPHESHQSGRDADVGYYLASNEQNRTMHRVKPHEVDLAKTWALVRCHITSDKVVRVYMDRKIQIAMIDWLRKKKAVDDGRIQRLFEVEGGDEALIRHAKDHDTHFHVRFACDTQDAACEEESSDAPFAW